MNYILSMLIGYIFGCSHMAYYISKRKNINLKENGSKNYGTSNAMALIGKKAGMLVFVHDFLKSFLAVVLIGFLFPNSNGADVLAGCAAVVGHIFPFYLHFDGGKGFASFIGVSFALFPLPSLLALVVVLLLAFISDYIVIATCSFIIFTPVFAFIKGDVIGGIILFSTALLIVWKHKENIVNLLSNNGKEMSVKKVVFHGSYKMDSTTQEGDVDEKKSEEK